MAFTSLSLQTSCVICTGTLSCLSTYVGYLTVKSKSKLSLSSFKIFWRLLSKHKRDQREETWAFSALENSAKNILWQAVFKCIHVHNTYTHTETWYMALKFHHAADISLAQMPPVKKVSRQVHPHALCAQLYTKFSDNWVWNPCFQTLSSEELRVQQRDDRGELLWGAAPFQVLQATLCSNSLRNLSEFSTSTQSLGHGMGFSSSWLLISLAWKTGLQGPRSIMLMAAAPLPLMPAWYLLSQCMETLYKGCQNWQRIVILYLCKAILWKLIISKSGKKSHH